MFLTRLLFAATITVGLIPVFSQAQTGFPQMGTFNQYGPITVDVANLNIHTAIPIFSKPGRGLALQLALGNDSLLWQPSSQWRPIANWGWAEVTTAEVGMLTYFQGQTDCPPLQGGGIITQGNQYSNFVYRDRSGGIHTFPITYTDCTGDNSPHSGDSGDAFPYHLDGTTITTPNGMTIFPVVNSADGTGQIIDTNGNEITVTSSGSNQSITDTTGKTALSISGSAPNPVQFTYTDSNGAQQSITEGFGSYTMRTSFGCPGISEATPTAASLPTSFTFPTGGSYGISYETTPGFGAGTTTGRISSITIPTGARINLTYTGANDGMNCSNGTIAGLDVQTTDGTWHYVQSTTSGTPFSTTTVTDPQGNETVYSFFGALQTQAQYNQGASTLLRTVETCYNGSAPPCATNNVGGAITQIDKITTLDNKQQSKESTFVNTQGFMTETDEYDFGGTGTTAPGPLKRKTLTTYAANVPPGRPDTIIVYDGSGTNQIAKTTYKYDDTPLTQTSGTPQHIGAAGPRGNLTHKSQWLNTTGGNLTSTYNYFDTGELQSVVDPGGHTTSFTYDTTGTFPLQTTFPDTSSPNLAHHVTHATFDVNTGLKLSDTDMNGQVTSYVYDGGERLTQTNFPDGGQTLISYPSLNETDTLVKIDSTGRYTFSAVLVDDYGRKSRTISKNDQSVPYDQQDFCYDSRGMLAFESYRYQGSGFGFTKVCTGAGDSFAYDGLGRPRTTTHGDGSSATATYTGRAVQVTDEGNGNFSVSRVLQTNGLGQLTGVCEVSSNPLIGNGGTPASCGLDIAATGFLTSYAYDSLGNLTTVAQGSLPNRTFAYDSLSRLTSESHPEWGQNSKASYTYDNDGEIIQRARPQPNQTNTSLLLTTSYSYDPLHRLTGRSYTNDPTSTAAASFDYDETSAWGVALTNTNGRESSEGAVTAGQIFGYDAMGRVANNWQCTPRTCGSGSNLMSYQYDLMGGLTQSTNGVGVTFNYTNNQAGRPTKMTSSLVDSTHPANLISNVAYGANGVISDTLGNGVTEAVGYTNRGQLQNLAVGGITIINNPATAGTGSVTVNGNDQSVVPPATAATGSVTIGGSEQKKCILQRGFTCSEWQFDSGSVSITVGTFTVSSNFNSVMHNTATSLAQDLATKLNGTGTPVTASLSGTVISLTSISTGSGANLALSSSATSTTGLFSFSGSPSGATLTGGGGGQTVWDAGTATITINGHANTVNYAQGSTSASVAGALAGAITNSDPYATASNTPGSNVVTITARSTGQATNYTLSASSATDHPQGQFSGPSFSGSPSGADLTGGKDASTSTQGATIYSYNLGYAPDGEITSANDSENGNWTYGYDQFSRLLSSNKNAGAQTFSYDYDRYGNRWHQNAPQGGPAPQYAMDDTSNRISGSGVTYDALGNELSDGLGNTFAYDAESRLYQVNGQVLYTYDAKGRRVKGPSLEYLYDLRGTAITQVDAASGGWMTGEVYLGGRHLATYSGSTTNFIHSDWLGTKRVMSGLNGAVSQACQNMPFGDGLSCTGTEWGLNHFTDDQHDGETNLEHTWFRKLSTTQGRFTSPDPYAGSMDLRNPQTMNRFAYVKNDPMNLTDRLGLTPTLLFPPHTALKQDVDGIWFDGSEGTEQCLDEGGTLGSCGGNSFGLMLCSVDGIAADCGQVKELQNLQSVTGVTLDCANVPCEPVYLNGSFRNLISTGKDTYIDTFSKDIFRDVDGFIFDQTAFNRYIDQILSSIMPISGYGILGNIL